MAAPRVDTDHPSTSRADQRRAMGGAAERDRRYQEAYDAGFHGVPASEHFAGRRDDDVDEVERDSHSQGVSDRRSGRRRQAARSAAGHARTVARTSGGYLARAGRSVTSHTGDIPGPSGGGGFIGVIVGVLTLILLFVALNHAGAISTALTGLTSGARWLISPSTLPI